MAKEYKEYIEREALLCMVQPDGPGDETAAITIATAKKLIRSLANRCPAADVAPVRHGRWIEYMKVIIQEPYNKREQAWKCSECGFDDGFITDPFCLNCGARMDLEKAIEAWNRRVNDES